MSKTIAAIIIVAASLSSASRPAAQEFSSDGLRIWLDAVAQHRPGEDDAAARLAARWTTADLERLLPAALHYLNTRRSFGADVDKRSPATCDSCQISRKERERLVKETTSRVTEHERAYISRLPGGEPLNAFIVRAVLLHSDAAMLLLKDSGIPVAASPRTALSTNVLKAYGQTMRTADSQYVDSAPKAPHWHMARALLHFMTPEPTQDPATRRWYLAASAFLAATGDFANLSTHLDAAQTLFPDEAMVAFDLGWRSEAHATSLLQNDKRALVEAAEQRRSGRKDVSRATVLCNLRYIPCDSRNNPFGIKSVRNSLTDAEHYFTRVVTLDPRISEAHVRLAYVRALLGRYADAEAALKNMPPASDAEVTFYAALVRGLTLDGLNRLDEAATAYEQALTLFPHAQSANLAMSVVQQKRGDTFGSVEFAKRAIAPELIAADPFRRYRYGRGRNVADAWAAVYASRAQ